MVLDVMNKDLGPRFLVSCLITLHHVASKPIARDNMLINSIDYPLLAQFSLQSQPPNQRYQAILATKLPGNLLTRNFRASSKSNKPIPNAIGKNQCSTGTVVVARTS